MYINIDKVCDTLSHKLHYSNRVIDSLYYYLEDEHPTSKPELAETITYFIGEGYVTNDVDDISKSQLV